MSGGMTDRPASERPSRAPRSGTRQRSYTHQYVDVRGLSCAEVDALVDSLWGVQVAVFDGVDRASFRRYLADPEAIAAAVEVHRDADGAVVGYYCATAFERVLDGAPCTVIRAAVAVLPEHRGLGRIPRFGVRFAMPLLVRYPLRRVYGFACPVHPVSYRMVAKYADGMFPHPSRETTDAQRRFLLELAGGFGLPAAQGCSELVREVGWLTRQCEGSKRAWACVDDAAARFYQAHNPDYGRGTGLLIAFPVSVAGALSALGRTSLSRLRRARFGGAGLRVAAS